MHDLIGDTHGHAAALTKLLKDLSDRQASFLRDSIH